MKKILIAVVVICLGLVLYAEDPENGADSRPFQLEIGGGLDAGIFGPLVALDATLYYQAGFLRAGIGARPLMGPDGDTYLFGVARIMLGPLGISGGAGAQLSDRRAAEGKYPVNYSDIMPYADVFLRIPTFTAGPGRMNVKVGLGGYFSAFTMDNPEDVEEAIGSIFAAGILAVFGLVKAQVGVSYSL